MIICNISPYIKVVRIAISVNFANISYNLQQHLERKIGRREYPVRPTVVVTPPKRLLDSTIIYAPHIRPFAQHIEPFRQQFHIPVQFCMGNFRIDLRGAYVFVT